MAARLAPIEVKCQNMNQTAPAMKDAGEGKFFVVEDEEKGELVETFVE